MRGRAGGGSRTWTKITAVARCHSTARIVRSDAFPDLYTKDWRALLGRLREGSRIYCATAFSGAGFKMASAYGEIAAYEVLWQCSFQGLDFVRPERFKAT